jgi:hypothetical protein
MANVLDIQPQFDIKMQSEFQKYTNQEMITLGKED